MTHPCSVIDLPVVRERTVQYFTQKLSRATSNVWPVINVQTQLLAPPQIVRSRLGIVNDADNDNDGKSSKQWNHMLLVHTVNAPKHHPRHSMFNGFPQFCVPTDAIPLAGGPQRRVFGEEQVQRLEEVAVSQ